MVQCQRLGSNKTCWDEPRGDRHHQDEDRHGARECDSEEKEQEQARDCEHHVDETHEQRVDPAAEEPGDGSPEDTKERCDQRCRDTDLERRLAADHQPADDIEAVLISTEQVARTRSQLCVVQVHRRLVRVVDQRTDEAEQGHEDDDAEADDRKTVLDKDVEREPPDTLGLVCRCDVLNLSRLLLRDRWRLQRNGDASGLVQCAHALRYLTRGSAIAYMMSAISEPRTVAKPVTTMTPRMIG